MTSALSPEDRITMRDLHLEKAHDVLYDVTNEIVEKMKPQSYEFVDAVEQFLNLHTYPL